MARYSGPYSLDSPLREIPADFSLRCGCSRWDPEGPHVAHGSVRAHRAYTQSDEQLFPCFPVAALPRHGGLLLVGRRQTAPYGLEVGLPEGSEREPEADACAEEVRFVVFAGRLDPRAEPPDVNMRVEFSDADVTLDTSVSPPRLLLWIPSPDQGNRRKFEAFRELSQGFRPKKKNRPRQPLPALFVAGAPRGGAVSRSEDDARDMSLRAPLCRIHTPFPAKVQLAYVGRLEDAQPAPTEEEPRPTARPVRVEAGAPSDASSADALRQQAMSEALAGANSPSAALEQSIWALLDRSEAEDVARVLVGRERWDATEPGSLEREELLEVAHTLARVVRKHLPPHLFDLSAEALEERYLGELGTCMKELSFDVGGGA